MKETLFFFSNFNNEHNLFNYIFFNKRREHDIENLWCERKDANKK